MITLTDQQSKIIAQRISCLIEYRINNDVKLIDKALSILSCADDDNDFDEWIAEWISKETAEYKEMIDRICRSYGVNFKSIEIGSSLIGEDDFSKEVAKILSFEEDNESWQIRVKINYENS